jgi:hypothetical protein
MGERRKAGETVIDSCYLLSMFRPIDVSCRLLTLYYFPLHLFFGIRDISDAIFTVCSMNFTRYAMAVSRMH